MVPWEVLNDDARPEAAGRVQRAARVQNAPELRDEEGEATSSYKVSVCPDHGATHYGVRRAYIPTGATGLAWFRSAASMKMVKTSCDVRNISRNKPCTTVMSLLSDVDTRRGPGVKASTRPAAAMPPSIWVTMRSMPRNQGRAPTRHMPKVTFWELAVSYVSVSPSLIPTNRCLGYEEEQHGGGIGWRGHELTAGLNRPPLMRKKAHTLTAREKPKLREM